MEAIQHWEMITAFVLPLILAFVMQQTWSSAFKAIIMFVVSALVVVGQLFVRDELNDWSDPVTTILRVIAFTITFYVGFWKPTGIAPKIEEATSVTK